MDKPRPFTMFTGRAGWLNCGSPAFAFPSTFSSWLAFFSTQPELPYRLRGPGIGSSARQQGA